MVWKMPVQRFLLEQKDLFNPGKMLVIAEKVGELHAEAHPSAMCWNVRHGSLLGALHLSCWYWWWMSAHFCTPFYPWKQQRKKDELSLHQKAAHL